MKRAILVILTSFFLFQSFNSKASESDCTIIDFVMDTFPCNGDGTYNILMNFSVIDPTSLGFSVWINGEFLNDYELSALPLIIENIEVVPGDDPITLEVCINDNPNCCASLTYFEPECGVGNCALEVLEIEFGGCDGETYGMWISFEAISPTQEIFDLWINDQYYGFYELGDLPLFVDQIVPSPGNVDWIEVCINDNENCCASMEYEQPECLENCFIGGIIVEPTECINGEFYFEIFFEYEGTSDFFEIFLNSEYYATFAYDLLPITIGPFDANDPISYNFLIHDLLDNGCSSILEFGEYNCGDDCQIIELGMEPGECDGDSYGLWIFFEVINPTQELFDLWINGEMVGFYNLNDLPLYVDGIIPQPGGVDWLEVCINDNPNCCGELEYLQPECLGGDCEIGEIIAEPTECEGDLFYFEITFESVNTSDLFNLAGNGFDYGEFAYGDLPILIGPFEGGDPTFYEFVITDSQDENCTNFLEFGEYMCEEDCVIDNLAVDPDECNEDGTYNMYFNFNVINPGNSYFDYYINDDIQGFALLNSLPLYIQNIVPRPNTDYDIIEVCINDNLECCLEFEYMQPECLTTNIEELNHDFSIVRFDQSLLVNVPEIQDYKINLYDLNGKLLKTAMEIQNNNWSIDLSGIPNGAYIINVVGENRNLTEKFVWIR